MSSLKTGRLASKWTWNDQIDSTANLEFHVVTPQPPNLEEEAVAHVIFIQAPNMHWATSLVSVFDTAPLPIRYAITTLAQIYVEHVLMVCNYDLACLFPNFPMQCQAWYDRVILQPRMPLPGRSGFSIILQIRRNRPVPAVAHALDEPNVDRQEPSLQRITQPVVISLESCLDSTEDVAQSTQVPIYLLDGAACPSLPDHVLVEDPVDCTEVELILASMLYILEGTGFAFCVPVSWTSPGGVTTYVYHPLHCETKDDIILHSDKPNFGEHAHMALLHSMGFTRAVVLNERPVRAGLVLVQYHNNQPTLETPQIVQKNATPWPKPMPKQPFNQVFQMPDVRPGPDFHLTLGIQLQDIEEFFKSSSQVLCPWHDHLELPSVVRDSLPLETPPLDQEVDWSSFDRLVIYTDGSSKAANRRKPPIWVQEHDVPDAWSFVVLGERYGDQNGSYECVFIGWHAQQVTYEQELSHHLGTVQVGSEFAEREALFWAGAWRLSLNCTLPTLFRSDSVTSAEQALGVANCHDQHPTYCHLRSVFQALQATLPKECIDDVQHVRGHTGDPWNEFADWLAKTEAQFGHKLKRQQINLRRLLPALPYFWMLFDSTAGLPEFTGSGFDITPPDLPPVQPASMPRVAVIDSSGQHRVSRMSISLATLNVCSLFAGPDGFGGKTNYIRAQMEKLGLNVFGLQETRSPPGMTQADHVIRLSSGATHGQHGVELWINTRQPIGFCGRKAQIITTQHLQAVHADSRRLLVRLVHPAHECLFAVLHAPQSGRTLQERKAWWTETQQFIHQYHGSFPLYVMMDANAKTGPCLLPIIHECDDGISANTEFFREFLQEHGLCLPSTTGVHQGPHATWTAIDGQSVHRIDYVAIPQKDLSHCTLSQVLEELDTGNKAADHCAVALQLTWNGEIDSPHREGTNTAFARSHDRAATQHRRHQIDLTGINVGAWTDDIEKHVQTFNAQIHRSLHEACPKQKQ